MKKLLIMLFLMAAGNAYAGCGTNCNPIPVPNNHGGSGATASQGQTSFSAAQNAGNRQDITINSAAQQPHTSASISSVPNPATSFVTASDGTCQGTTAQSLGILNFGESAAQTYTVIPCNRRLDSLAQYNEGEKEVAVQMFCTDPTVYTIRKQLGKPCVVRPDMSTYLIPGGQIGNLAIPVGAPLTAKAEVVTKQQANPNYVTHQELNNRLDAVFKHTVTK